MVRTTCRPTTCVTAQIVYTMMWWALQSGSIEKVVINLGETCKETRKKTKFTPSSPIKATPDDITSDEDYLSMMSVSDDNDVINPKRK